MFLEAVGDSAVVEYGGAAAFRRSIHRPQATDVKLSDAGRIVPCEQYGT